MQRLKKRREFLSVAKGRRVHTGLFSLQSVARDDTDAPRTGFTVTKKVGHAVERNRIRRRFKEAVRLGGQSLGEPGHDYVLVARRDSLSAPFSDLCNEIARAFSRAGRAQRTAGETGDKPGPRRPH